MYCFKALTGKNNSVVLSINNKIIKPSWHAAIKTHLSSCPEVFLRKRVLKIGSKFTGERPYRSRFVAYFQNTFLKDTHREKVPSNKTPALRKSTNTGVWAVGTLNQLFIRGS